MPELGSLGESAQLLHKQRIEADTAASRAAFASAQTAMSRSAYVKIAFWGAVILVAGGIAFWLIKKRGKSRR